MLVDFNSDFNGIPTQADFCIVGSGPAGMTLAMELDRYGRSVILLEGGDVDMSLDSQELYKGTVIGDHYVPLDAARLRYLGGTSGHWGGWCTPLTEISFQKKAAFADAHWPIEKKDLDPFFSRALSILDIRPPSDEVILDSEFGITEFAISLSRVKFGRTYREKLSSSKNITCATNANLTRLDTNGRRVVSARASNFGGRSATVRAKHFVLAMGGIENSRMLLWCNHQAKGRIVDAKAPLGRYWMEHPAYKVGHALVDLKIPKTDYYVPHLLLRFTDQIIRKLSMLECSIVLEAIESHDTKGLLRELVCVAPKIGEWAASLANKNIVCGARLIVGWEQEPIHSNHVKLSDTTRDRFGIPTVELHWKKTDRDRATLQRALTHFNEYLMARNRGRIKLEDWVFGNEGYPVRGDDGVSYHHMGGTRMARTAQEGVVDSNCRVFGQDNLYVAGSSVFPSGGEGNPTLTIVQLSLRLAEHLRHA